MGGQQPTIKEYPYAKYFNNEGNPYNKTQDEKLKDLKAELKDYAVQVWDDISMLYAFSSQETKNRVELREDIEDNEMLLKDEITYLKKEIDFLKQQITNGSSGKWGVYASKDEMKCQFDDYRQMQILLKQSFDKLESKFDAASKGLAVVKPTIDIKQPIKVEPPKNDLDGWMTASDLTEHIKALSESGKRKYNARFCVRGGINNISLRLGIVEKGRGSMVNPSDFGMLIGYVKSAIIGKTHACVYNVEKYEKLLAECTEDPFAAIDSFEDIKNKYYAGVTA